MDCVWINGLRLDRWMASGSMDCVWINGLMCKCYGRMRQVTGDDGLPAGAQSWEAQSRSVAPGTSSQTPLIDPPHGPPSRLPLKDSPHRHP
eukprot:7094256-Pyramimonas_sp.AAC.1